MYIEAPVVAKAVLDRLWALLRAHIVVVVPEHTIDKWIKEANKELGGSKISDRCLDDYHYEVENALKKRCIIDYCNNDQSEYVYMSKDTPFHVK